MDTKYFNPKTVNPRAIPERIIQSKLEVNPPNDEHEKEADHVANKVMRMSSNPIENHQMLPQEGVKNKIHLKPTEENEKISMKPSDEPEDSIQMFPKNFDNNYTPQVSETLASQLQTKKGQGSPLSTSISNEMGKKIGADFSNVRIHNDSSAIQMTKELGAKAFTHGNDIYFNSGKYNPESTAGKKLLVHELTHTMQQKNKRLSAKNIQRSEENTFIVPKGWNLIKIANHFGVSIEDLIKINIDKFRISLLLWGFEEGESIVIPNHPPTRSAIADIYRTFVKYVNKSISIKDLAETLLLYLPSSATEILKIFDTLHSEGNELACIIAENTSDKVLVKFSLDLLKRMSLALSDSSNVRHFIQRRRIIRILGITEKPEIATEEVKTQAIEDLNFLRKTFNYNISGSVGDEGDNIKIDVKFIARGLQAKGFDVPTVALNEGICNDALIAAIIRFQEQIVGMKKPNGLVETDDETLDKIFDRTNDSYSSGLKKMFGRSARHLNKFIENEDPFSTWKRGEKYDTNTKKYLYTINNKKFLEQKTYTKYVAELAKAKGVKEGSDLEKVLGMAARAASDNAYFNELTKDVGFRLALRNETAGPHQVNSVLKDRLMRFHKFMSAVGMFNGNMKGSACRAPAVAHQLCIAHVMIGNTRPESSKRSVRNNLITVYNGANVNGGIRTGNGEVADSDNFVWARSEHFQKIAGRAVAMNDTSWFSHMRRISPGRNWNVYVAEGYAQGDVKRFPLGLRNQPSRSNHVTGDAIDINAGGFVNKNEAMIDLIALNFGLIRPVPGEQWHFECTNMQLTANETKLVNNNPRESIKT